MSSISDFFKKNADVLGNDVFSKITDAVGLPALPPLKFQEPYQNQNNYVEARPAPAAIQPETAAPVTKNWLLYGAIGLGVIAVVGLMLKKG